MGRPRANAIAWRIVAKPYFGILYDDQLWTQREWDAIERRRATWRRYRRPAPGFYDHPDEEGNDR